MRHLFLFAALVSSPLAAQPQPTDSLPPVETEPGPSQAGSLARVMDAFLRAYAAENPAWRMDVTTQGASEDSTPPEGFQKGHSDLGLWYHFRPKTAEQLKIDERRAVMRDKRFGPFIAQMRGLADGQTVPLPPAVAAAARPAPPASPKPEISRADLLARLLAGRRPPPEAVTFEVTGEELLLPGRLLVVVDTTASTP